MKKAVMIVALWVCAGLIAHGVANLGQASEWPHENQLRIVALTAAFVGVGDNTLADSQAQLRDLQDRHRAAVASIHSVECDVEVKHERGKESARYVRSGNDVAVQCQLISGGVAEFVNSGSVVRSLTRNAGQLPSGIIQAYNGQRLSGCDIWSKGLLQVISPNNDSWHPLDKLIGDASKLKGPRQEKVDGRDLSVIEMVLDKPGRISEKWTALVYLDPAVNWLVRRMTISAVADGTQIERTLEVKQFKEEAPGVFFPVLLEARLRLDGKDPKTQYVATVTNIKLNRRVLPQAFQLAFPVGTIVTDRIRGENYRVEPGGRQVRTGPP